MLGRTPSPEELATMLDVPTDTVHKLVEDVHRATVLNYDSLVLEGDAESFIAGDDDGPEDTILDRVWLPTPRAGDRVLIGNTGAYTTCYSGRSAFNGSPAPAVTVMQTAA